MKKLIAFFIESDVLQPLLGWLTVLSLLTFILSLLIIPLVVGRLQQDCFLKLTQNEPSSQPLSFSFVILAILRNCAGLLLLFAGIIMLFLPGQGLLTILLGTFLISFPGRKKLIKSLVYQPKIQRAMDWIRKKRGQPPFLWPKP